jgi:hypothetical protein
MYTVDVRAKMPRASASQTVDARGARSGPSDAGERG